MKRLTKCFALLAALASLFAAMAQSNRSRPSNQNTRLTPGEMAFAEKAQLRNIAAESMGTLAQERGKSAAVKDLGKRMVMDHTRANEYLIAVVSSSGGTLPTMISGKDQQVYDRLAALNGAAFDQAYVQYIISQGRMDINEFKNEASNGVNPGLKAYANRVLPILHEHLKLAETASNYTRGEK